MDRNSSDESVQRTLKLMGLFNYFRNGKRKISEMQRNLNTKGFGVEVVVKYFTELKLEKEKNLKCREM